jgi:hypothetical protein
MKKPTIFILIAVIVVSATVVLILLKDNTTTEIKTNIDNFSNNKNQNTNSVIGPSPDNIVCTNDSDCGWAKKIPNGYGCGCYNIDFINTIETYSGDEPIIDCGPQPTLENLCSCRTNKCLIDPILID